MKKSYLKDKNIKKIFEIYKQYQNFKKVSKFVREATKPPFTLDQQIENINPYYVRTEVIRYG